MIGRVNILTRVSDRSDRFQYQSDSYRRRWLGYRCGRARVVLSRGRQDYNLNRLDFIRHSVRIYSVRRSACARSALFAVSDVAIRLRRQAQFLMVPQPMSSPWPARQVLGSGRRCPRYLASDEVKRHDPKPVYSFRSNTCIFATRRFITPPVDIRGIRTSLRSEEPPATGLWRKPPRWKNLQTARHWLPERFSHDRSRDPPPSADRITELGAIDDLAVDSRRPTSPAMSRNLLPAWRRCRDSVGVSSYSADGYRCYDSGVWKREYSDRCRTQTGTGYRDWAASALE